jgi:hypothetical protein
MAECFFSSILLRFDAIPKAGKYFFFVLVDSLALSEGSALYDLRFFFFLF